MSFNSNVGRQSFTASAGQTDFTFNFKIYDETDIKVYLTPVGNDPDDTADILAYGSDYTVSIDGDNGGTVTLLSGATLNDTLVFERVLPRTRATSYVTNGDLKAATLNADQDYQTYLLVDDFNTADRSLSLPSTEVTLDPELPATIAGGYLKVKEDGTGYEYILLSDIVNNENIQVIQSINDFISLDINLIKIVILQDNLRGGIFFYNSTGAPDNVDVNLCGVNFSASVGVFSRYYAGEVNIKWFGADPSDDVGSTNTLSIQAALDSLLPIYIPNDNFTINGGLTATHKLQLRCSGVITYIGTAVYNEIVLDITTSTDDLDFSISPTIDGLRIVGNDIAYCGIRINSVLAPKILNYHSKGFTDGWALVFRNIALVSGARWNEAYYVENIVSNYNKGGIRFHIEGGTTSFGYGYISGNITNRIGTVSNQSIGMFVETTQLYQTKIDLNIWCNGYGTAIKVGSSSYTGAKIYWCDLRLGGEAFNTGNYSIDLTDGQIFGCTGNARLNQGQVLNPSNNRLEIYGQYQRTSWGNTTKQINGVDTKLVPLAASFQVEDAFSGKPEGGFGIAQGSNMTCPIVWMQDAINNSFRVVKAAFDSEPSTDTPMFEVRWDGSAITNNKSYAKTFVTKETTFVAVGSTTTTEVIDIQDLTGDTKGAYIISANASGANTNLSIIGLCTFAADSSSSISPVVTLITEDYNYGSIALQTYGNLPASQYSAGNGRKFQLVVNNGNATDMTVYVTITRIG